MDIWLILNSILFGVSLAMDAFSVSMANGLHEPKMKKRKETLIALTFALFQTVMPMIGWICVHTILECFQGFKKAIPWIALILLLFIGTKMLIEGIRSKEEEGEIKIGVLALLVQGVATSIDALSVGFDIAKYQFWEALISVLIIGIITFIICLTGIIIGKKFGTALSNKASILGGIILIAIGIEIFVKGLIENGGIF
ncbi:MAG: manganese efflux pump [Clostridia bacterium]|nr:manganese efflux pump [Clostridia bacterium]